MDFFSFFSVFFAIWFLPERRTEVRVPLLPDGEAGGARCGGHLHEDVQGLQTASKGENEDRSVVPTPAPPPPPYARPYPSFFLVLSSFCYACVYMGSDDDFGR